LPLEVAVQADKCSAEDRVVEVGAEGVVTEVEQHMGAVVLHADVEVLRDGRYAGFQWETWDVTVNGSLPHQRGLGSAAGPWLAASVGRLSRSESS